MPARWERLTAPLEGLRRTSRWLLCPLVVLLVINPKVDVSMVVALRAINLALRSLMEVGIVAAFGYWGLQTGKSAIASILLSIGAPVLVFGFWGLVDFRNAGQLSEPLRLFQELVISGLAAFAFYAAGQHTLGWALALISIVHHALVYLLGETLLKKNPSLQV
jgi:hypothetical protein